MEWLCDESQDALEELSLEYVAGMPRPKLDDFQSEFSIFVRFSSGEDSSLNPASNEEVDLQETIAPQTPRTSNRNKKIVRSFISFAPNYRMTVATKAVQEEPLIVPLTSCINFKPLILSIFRREVAESVVKGKMLWIRVGFVAVLAALIAAGEAITLAPALVWGAGFPFFMIVRNWRALKYSKKRPFNAEQVASNFEKGMQDKSKSDG